MGLKEGFTFFSDIDRRFEGRRSWISSSYPQWYFTRHNAQRAEELQAAERRLKQAVGVDEKVAKIAQYHVTELRTWLSEVKAGRPKATAAEETHLKEFYSEGEKRIADEWYSEDDDKRGLVDPHVQLAKETLPYIPVGKYGDVFEACNIKPVDGKVTLKQFIITWKIVGRYFSFNTNTLYLRPKGGGKPHADTESDFYKYLRKHGM